MKKTLFLISVLVVWVLMTPCKSPMEPEIPPQEDLIYWPQIEVLYERDPAKIRCPEGNDNWTIIRYELYDPQPKIKSKNDWYIEGYYRVGRVKLEKIAENKFRGYLENVFAQTKYWDGKHFIYIRDYKLYDGISEESAYTPYGISVERAYEEEIRGYKLSFKIRRE